MKWFEVKYQEVVSYTACVKAEDEDKALDLLKLGEVTDLTETDSALHSIVSVKEIHDPH